MKSLGDILGKIIRLFNDYAQKQQILDVCLSNRLDRLNIQCVSNDIGEESKENWTRIIDLIKTNELTQMNIADLATYSKLILELDTIVASYRRTISTHKHVVSSSEKAMLQVCVRLIDQCNNHH